MRKLCLTSMILIFMLGITNSNAEIQGELVSLWTKDIEEFQHTTMHFSGYTDIGGHSPINSSHYTIKIGDKEADSLKLYFNLNKVMRGGNRIRDWSNDKDLCSSDDTDTIYPTAVLKPSSQNEAKLVFLEFPECVLQVKKPDSNTLLIDGLENPKCSFLEQKCMFDVDEEVYITNEYHKIEAGFDCTKASSASEKAICADADLAYMDKSVNVLYEALYKNAKDIGKAIGKNLALDVLNSQRTYLKARNACKGNTKCIEDTMSERINTVVKELAEYQ